jgi:hypothetical protein
MTNPDEGNSGRDLVTPRPKQDHSLSGSVARTSPPRISPFDFQSKEPATDVLGTNGLGQVEGSAVLISPVVLVFLRGFG